MFSNSLITNILKRKNRKGWLQKLILLLFCSLWFEFSGQLSAQDCPKLSIEYAIDVKWGVIEFYRWPENLSMEENTMIAIQDKEGRNVDYKWYGNNLLWINWQHRDDAFDIEVTYRNALRGCETDTLFGVWYPFFDVELFVDSGSGKKGQEVCLPVKANNFLAINNFDFSYSWPSDSLQFNGIKNINPSLAGALETEVIVEGIGRHSLHILNKPSWKDTVSIDEEEILFEMCFTPLMCGPYEVNVQAEETDKSLQFEMAGVNVAGSSNSGTIIVEDESDFIFELVQMCTSSDPDLFDFQLKIPDGIGPFTYTFGTPGRLEGSFMGSDTTVFGIPAGNYEVTLESQCAEATQSLSLRKGEGIREGDFKIEIDPLEEPSCTDQYGGKVMVNVEPESSDYKYRWIEENMEFEDGILFGLPANTQTIEVTDSLNCKRTEEISLNFKEDLSIDWSEGETSLCPDQKLAKVHLQVSSSNFQISIDGGSQIENPNYLELPLGDHSLMITTPAGCQKNETISISQVEPYDPGNNLGKEIFVVEGQPIKVNIEEPPFGSDISWTVEGNEVGNETELFWKPNKSESLNLGITYPPKCKYDKKVAVELIEKEAFFEQFLPNAFSPNGDMINDILKVSATKNGIVDEVLQLEVFDRYGSLLFSKGNYDSTNKNGVSWNGLIGDQLAEPNTYLAKVMFRLSDGSIKTISWSVLLIH